jgi:hypothetical protein
MIASIILALGLAAVGILSLKILNQVATHRAPAMVDHPERRTVDEQAEHQPQVQQPVDGQQVFRALISAVSDYGRPQVDDDFERRPEVSKRRFKLAQLHQRLDRLLQFQPG